MSGEASILGDETGDAARGSSGVSGATCQDRRTCQLGRPYQAPDDIYQGGNFWYKALSKSRRVC